MKQPEIQTRLNLKLSDFVLDLDLTLPGEGVTVLFGASGSGKTTFLRCLAGLEKAEGAVSVRGQVWQSDSLFIPTHKRPLGYVFQEASLLPHLSVLNNLKYGLKRSPQQGRSQLLEEVIQLLDIGHLLTRKPARLSGGERQRIAIARALVLQPQILLMDEPLASLDQPRKQEVLPFLERVCHSLKTPILYVTHSTDEMARLADYLVVFSSGKVLAHGSLDDMLSRLDLPLLQPTGQGPFIVIKTKVAELDPTWSLARLAFEGGSLWVKDQAFAKGDIVRLRILARDISLTLDPAPQSSILNILPVQVSDIQKGGHPAVRLVQLQTGELKLLSQLTARSIDKLALKVGSQLWAQIKSVAIID